MDDYSRIYSRTERYLRERKGSTEYGSFAWTNPAVIPNGGTAGYSVTFTPSVFTEQNYEPIKSKTQDVNVTVEQAVPTVTVEVKMSGNSGSRAADLIVNVSGVPNGVTPEGSVTFTGDGLSETLSLQDGETTCKWEKLSNKEYSVTAAYSGDINYKSADGQLTFEASSFGGISVEAVKIIGIEVTDKIYDGKEAVHIGAPSAVTSGGTMVTIPAEAYTYAWYETDGRKLEGAPVDAGDYKLVVSMNTGVYAGSRTIEFKIAKREVTALIDDKSMIIDGEVPELTLSYDGFVGEDNKDNALLTQAELTTKADGKPLGNYDITFKITPVLNDIAEKNYTLKCDDKGILSVVEKSEKSVYLLAKTGSKKTSVKVSWNKAADADGYLVYGAECGKSYKLLKKVSARKVSWEQKNLKKGSPYKFYVAAYRLNDGKRETIVTSPKTHIMTRGGRYGNPTKVSVSDKAVSVGREKITKITARVSRTNGRVKNHVAAVRYLSTDKSVATVTAKGKIKGIKAGICYVYCYAQDGVAAKVKVTVK